MGNLLYVIAVILVIAWAIGFLGYHAGGIIHILLVIAIVVVLLKVIRGSADWKIEVHILNGNVDKWDRYCFGNEPIVV